MSPHGVSMFKGLKLTPSHHPGDCRNLLQDNGNPLSGHNRDGLKATKKQHFMCNIIMILGQNI